MIAEISPQTGGAPDAIAMPSESGIPIMATCSPAIRSYRQCFNPATPFWGFSFSGISSTVRAADPCDDMPFLLSSSSVFFGAQSPSVRVDHPNMLRLIRLDRAKSWPALDRHDVLVGR